MVSFAEMEKHIPNLYGIPRKPKIAKIIWKKKHKAGGLILPNFRTYYKTIVINTVRGQHKNRN